MATLQGLTTRQGASILANKAGIGAYHRDEPARHLMDTPVSPRTALETAISSLLPRYELLDELGQGGMGIVYRARDPRLERTVVLKLLPPHMTGDELAKKRFLVEAKAAAALEHPNICTIHEFGETSDGLLYIVMAYYDGETLDKRLLRGALPAGDALTTAIEIAKGLSRAHDSGIVHRDIKPANVIITKDGTVKILDFGIAKLADHALTMTGGIIGTVAYMSPEQMLGDPVDARSDIWSLGVLLYEMITGSNPFRRENPQATMYAVMTAEVEPVSVAGNGVPASLDRLFGRVLTRQKSERFATAHEMIEHLKSVLIDLSPGASAGVRRQSGPGMLANSSGLTKSGERRQTTVVVSQIPRYADLVERASPADIETIIETIRQAATQVSAAHGGILNQFEGDELIVLFGVPVAHEDDFVRAARFALAMHERLDVIASATEHRHGVKLQLRTGIHTGVVVAQRLHSGDSRFRIAGPALTVANRLAGIATAGQVVASPETQRLISPFFLTQALPAITVHDDSAPSIPYRITGESGAASRLEAGQASGLTPYTGRARELSSLHEQLDLARSGSGQIALIMGDAGVGKSRLLFEFQRSISGASVRTLRGRCDAARASIPYLPFTHVLEDALGIAREGRDAQELHDSVVAGIRSIGLSLDMYLPFLLHLLSIPSTAFPVPRHLEQEEFHSAMADALMGFLTVEAQRTPTLVALEDWHWADDASHRTLQQLSEIASGFTLLVVVTSRPERNRDIGGGEHRRVVHLGPVDAAASLDLMKAVLDVDRVSDNIAREVLRRADGNPFFIEEMCRSLLESHALGRAAGEAVVTDCVGMARLPDTVQAVIGTRIDRLEPAARDVLKVAAIIGTDFRRNILDEVVEKGLDVARCIELLKSAGLVQQTAVVPHAAYRFRHVLTQEVAYGSLLEHQRSALHSSIGHAIEQLEPDRRNEQADVLSRHFSRAREWHPAISYSLIAADRALRLNQFRQSLAILDAAHDWVFKLDEGPARDELLADILFRQERTCETLGLRERQHQLVETLIDLLRKGGGSAKLAEAYLRQGELYTLLRQFYLAAQALETSLQTARNHNDELAERNALRSLGFMSWQQGNFDQALVSVRAALEIDRRRGDQEAAESDLNNLGRIYKGAGDYNAALECLEESMRLVAERGDRIHISYALNAIGQVHRARGDLEQALDYLQRAEESARIQGLTIQSAFNMTSVARVLFQLGQTDESVAKYQEAIDLCQRAGYAPGLAQSLRLCGDVMIDLKRDSEAADRLAEAAKLFHQLEDPETEGGVLVQLAATLERLGRWSEALTAWETARALPRSTGGIEAELDAVEGMARASRSAGLPRDVVIHRYEEALALCLTAGDAARRGALLNTVGILEFERTRYEEAANHYRNAASVFHDIGDGIHEGLMLNSLGVTLTRLNRDDEAGAALEDARDLNVDSGQRLLQAHSLSALAELAMRAGDFDRAGAGFRESLDIHREIGDRRGEGWSLLNLARAHRATGDSGVALSLESDARSVAIELKESALEQAIAKSTESNLNSSSQGD